MRIPLIADTHSRLIAISGMRTVATTPAPTAASAAAAIPAAAAVGDCEKQAADKKSPGAAKNSFAKKRTPDTK